MNCDPARLLAGQPLDLTGVHAGTDVQTEGRQGSSDLERAADRPRRTVERCEEAVTGRVEFLTGEAAQLASYGPVVLVEERGPAFVAEALHVLGRAHEVGAEDRRQNPLGRRRRTCTSEELLDLVEDLIGVDGGYVVVPGELDEARPLDPRGDVSPFVHAGI